MRLLRPPLRLSVPLTLLVFGSLLALVWLEQTLRASYQRAEQNAIQSAHLLATFAGPQLEAFFRVGDAERAPGFLNRLNSDPAWRRVLLVDPQGRILYSSRFAEEGTALAELDDETLQRRGERAMTARQDRVELGAEGASVHGEFPVRMPQPGVVSAVPHGVLLVERDLLADKALARAQAMAGFFRYLAALGALCLLGWWVLDRLLTRRLQRILEVTDRLAGEERGARVGLTGNDELVAIARAIDRMAERLEVAHCNLAESESSFRQLIAHGTDMIAVLDGRGTVRFVSPSARRILGGEPEEWIGRCVLEAIHRDDREAAARLLALALETGVETPLVELRMRHEDGRWIALEVVGNSPPERQARGEVVVNARDITDWQFLQDQLRQAQKMEAVGLLAGGIAHDFNNLLTAILGYCDLLTLELGDRPDALAQVREIHVAGERGAGLVRQLLAFGRTQVLTLEELDLDAVVLEMKGLVQRALGERIRLELALDPEPCWVRADRGQIEQVLLNLAVNARDAMPEGGRLRVSVVAGEQASRVAGARAPEGEDFVLLSVADDGEGIGEGIEDRIFDPFFTTKARGKGSGLGLATVHGIVHQSGGRVWVESVPGRGATFRVQLPRVAAPDGSPQKSRLPRERLEAPRSAGTALVLEDDRAIRRLVVGGLERAGYRVMEADCLERAQRVLDELDGKIDLLVSDVVLPDGSGLTVAESVADRYGDARIVLISGYSAELARRSAAVPSRYVFLPKPFAIAELLRVVERGERVEG
ncbi:MAG TPA: ATP-binding protein [Thermoanaerobaculia bacterium]|nr:ATP-binding protein [Thermoanaerobaculia bacterium]